MKKVVLINNRKFLLTSALALKNSVNLLGFYSTKNGCWGNHVSSVSLTHDQFNNILSIESKAKSLLIQNKHNLSFNELGVSDEVMFFIEDNKEWLAKETETPLDRISALLKVKKL